MKSVKQTYYIFEVEDIDGEVPNFNITHWNTKLIKNFCKEKNVKIIGFISKNTSRNSARELAYEIA